jgi:Na+/proline symporter
MYIKLGANGGKFSTYFDPMRNTTIGRMNLSVSSSYTYFGGFGATIKTDQR